MLINSSKLFCNPKESIYQTKVISENLNDTKLVFTFGNEGNWLIKNLNLNIANINIPVINDEMARRWWDGLMTFYQMRETVIKEIEKKNEIIIITNKLFGFYVGFILSLVSLLTKRNKKIIVITSFSTKNNTQVLDSLALKATIYDVMKTKEYKDELALNPSLLELDNCLNRIYLEKLKNAFDMS